MVKKISRKDIESRLSDFCDVSKISDCLSDKDRDILFRLSLRFAVDAVTYEEKGGRVLGINVGKSIVRNYLFALLTGNAVRYLAKKGVKKPVIVEMGMGSGLNGAAAFLMNDRCKYIGVERDDDCIIFAAGEFVALGMECNVEIIKADYSSVVLKKKADIVINENLSPNFVEEPQIIASNKVLKNVHKHTVFVPSSVQLFGLFDGVRSDFRRLCFDKRISPVIAFSKDLSGKKDVKFRVGYDVFDFQGNVAVKQGSWKDYISYLPCIGDEIIIKPKPKSKKTVKIILDTNTHEIIVE
jgi:predicted RNA methylase